MRSLHVVLAPLLIPLLFCAPALANDPPSKPIKQASAKDEASASGKEDGKERSDLRDLYGDAQLSGAGTEEKLRAEKPSAILKSVASLPHELEPPASAFPARHVEYAARLGRCLDGP